MGGGAAGQGAGILPAGHSPEAGHVPSGHEKVRIGGKPPTKLLSAKERAKAEALAASLIAAD